MLIASSPSREIRWTSRDWSAKNTSAWPVTVIVATPSPLSFCLIIFPMPPAPWKLKSAWPWYATIAPCRAVTLPLSVIFSIFEFCSENIASDWTSVFANSSLFMAADRRCAYALRRRRPGGEDGDASSRRRCGGGAVPRAAGGIGPGGGGRGGERGWCGSTRCGARRRFEPVGAAGGPRQRVVHP